MFYRAKYLSLALASGISTVLPSSCPLMFASINSVVGANKIYGLACNRVYGKLAWQIIDTAAVLTLYFLNKDVYSMLIAHIMVKALKYGCRARNHYCNTGVSIEFVATGGVTLLSFLTLLTETMTK